MAEPEKKRLIDRALLRSYLHRAYRSIKWPVVLLIAVLIISPRFWQFWGNANIHFNSSIILDYISVLRWPIVALIITLVLRPHLPGLIDRLRKFGAAGVGAEFDPPASQQLSSPDVSELQENEESREAAHDTTPDENEQLHELLTSPQAKVAFEQIYTEIFGTQITLLKRLHANADSGLNANQLYDIYVAHTQSSDPAYPSLVAFMQWLIDNVLVLYEADTKLYKLTNAGLYFLIYLTERGVFEKFKPY